MTVEKDNPCFKRFYTSVGSLIINLMSVFALHNRSGGMLHRDVRSIGFTPVLSNVLSEVHICTPQLHKDAREANMRANACRLRTFHQASKNIFETRRL